MKFFHKNIRFIYFLLLLGNVYAQPRVGFVPDGSNYYEAFSEGTDGVVYVQVTNVTIESTITFYVNVHTTAPSYGTANLSNNDHGSVFAAWDKGAGRPTSVKDQLRRQ